MTLIAVQDGRIGAKAFDPCSGAHGRWPEFIAHSEASKPLAITPSSTLEPFAVD